MIGKFGNSAVLLAVCSYAGGCSVVTDKKEEAGNGQKIEFGLMGVDGEVEARGTMVPWDNSLTDYPLGASWGYGIEFEFDVNLIQSVHAYIDSDQNFDCDFGARLMGPSYYLKLADGTMRTFEYEKRSEESRFPGKGDYDFPGAIPAGAHKLVARWYSNEVCRMDVAVAVKDRFAPVNNGTPYIQRVDLLGEWTSGALTYKFSTPGMLTMTEGAETAAAEVFDFPYNQRFTARVTSSGGGASDWKAGDVFYCSYAIDTSASPTSMVLRCNDPGDTSVPNAASAGVIFTK